MYVKLFASLYQGTLRGRSDEILVFTNLLAHADQYGIVDKHFKAIAEETGLPRERVETAIENLEAPDPESRSPELNGCRIARLDDHRVWGWKIVNYGKYRTIRNEEDRREQNRLAQQRYRVSHGKPRSAQAEAEADTKAIRSKAKVAPLALPPWLNAETWTEWLKVRKAKSNTHGSLQAALKKLEGFKAAGFDPNEIVSTSLANGWQGLFPPDAKKGAVQQPAARPSKVCEACGARVFTWTGNKCDSCWRGERVAS